MGVYHDLLAQLRSQSQGCEDLDIQVGCRIGRYQPSGYLAGWLVCAKTGALLQAKSCLRYTRSLDDAVTIYPILPARVPSDPISACIEALQAREEQADLLL